MNGFTSFLLSLPAIVIAIGFHEAAHAYVAYQLGDNTARNQGRLTLNPAKHIDPIGLLMLLIFRFGWAKPVPINPNNFKNRKLGTVLTALAGPVTNLLIAFIAMILYIIFGSIGINSTIGAILLIMIQMIITINVGLAVFNFIPIPPLDGSKVLFAILPSKYYYKFLEHQNVIQIILILLLFTDILSMIISPIILWLENVLFKLAFLIVSLVSGIFV